MAPATAPSIRLTRRPAGTAPSGGRSRLTRSTASPQEWDSNRADYTQRILDYWRIYASNLEGDNLFGSYLFTPLDVERLNANMRQGAVRMGAYVPNQLGINRPHPLMPGSRTPVEGLYLVRLVVRQRRRRQRRARLYRRQRHRRRSCAQARLDAGAAAGMAALSGGTGRS